MTRHTADELADLAEVAPPRPGSVGEGFLFRVAEDVEDRLDQLSSHFNADEIPSIADASLEMPNPALWPVWDLSLWDEDITHLVPANADMTWRAETAVREVGLRLAAALVAQALRPPITFAQARALADAACWPTWDPNWGTFMVAREGCEDATHYNVGVGSMESLVFQDIDFLIVGGPATLVDKANGEVTFLPYLRNLDRLQAMTPVSDPG